MVGPEGGRAVYVQKRWFPKAPTVPKLSVHMCGFGDVYVRVLKVSTIVEME